MKRYSIVHIPFLSFFSRDLYIDVGLKWKGTGFGYLLLLLAVCWLPLTVKMHRGLSNFIDNETPPFLEQFPTITIDNGRASIDQPQPYYIKAPDSNDVIAIIDTTGEIQSLDNTDALILMTQTQLIHRESDTVTKTFDLAQIEGHHVLDKDTIQGFLSFFKALFFPIAFIFLLFGSFLYRIIQALIYAAIGLLFASLCNANLSYAALLRVAVVAVTPCIIVNTVLELTTVNLPWAFLWYFLAALGYLLFGVNAISQAQETPIEGVIEPENPQQWPGH